MTPRLGRCAGRQLEWPIPIDPCIVLVAGRYAKCLLKAKSRATRDHWPASSNAATPNDAFGADFKFGFVVDGNRANDGFVRAVRAGSWD